MEQYLNICGAVLRIVQCFAIIMENWYAVIMNVERSKLGLDGDDTVEIIDVKCDPEMTGMIIQTYGFLPGYHMNKQHWITILLDGIVGESKILDFLDMSYDLIDGHYEGVEKKIDYILKKSFKQ